jgi:hypothetical protein
MMYDRYGNFDMDNGLAQATRRRELVDRLEMNLWHPNWRPFRFQWKDNTRRYFESHKDVRKFALNIVRLFPVIDANTEVKVFRLASIIADEVFGEENNHEAK